MVEAIIYDVNSIFKLIVVFRLVNDLLTLVINNRAKLGFIAINSGWIIFAFVLDLRCIVAWLILDTRRPTSIQSAHKRGGRE